MTSSIKTFRYDAVIVGGGPAGLSAALVLGRCRRSVLLFDSGAPRNASASKIHAFISRDGTPPREFLAHANRDLESYPNVEVVRAEAHSVNCGSEGLTVRSTDRSVIARRVLLATGVVDSLPTVVGLRELYGSSVFHCPYCDGWEFRDQPLGVYGRGKSGCNMALELTQWSSNVLLFTDGAPRLSELMTVRLERAGVRVLAGKVDALEGSGGVLHTVRLKSGESVPRRALFFVTEKLERSSLPRSLGCKLNSREGVHTVKREATSVPFVYAAGDVVRDLQMVVFAAAQGAKAAVGINISLLEEDLKKKGSGLIGGE